MLRFHVTDAGARHDVGHVRHELENLETVSAQVAIAAKISVSETEQMSELVSQRARRDLVRSEYERPRARYVRGRSAGGEHRCAWRKPLEVIGEIDRRTAVRHPAGCIARSGIRARRTIELLRRNAFDEYLDAKPCAAVPVLPGIDNGGTECTQKGFVHDIGD